MKRKAHGSHVTDRHIETELNTPLTRRLRFIPGQTVHPENARFEKPNIRNFMYIKKKKK